MTSGFTSPAHTCQQPRGQGTSQDCGHLVNKHRVLTEFISQGAGKANGTFKQGYRGEATRVVFEGVDRVKAVNKG